MLSFLKALFTTEPRLPADVARAMLDDGKAILVDVREPDELRSSGRAKGALHLPLSSLAQRGDPQSGHFERKLKPAMTGEKALILYCATGMRSGRAARMLRAKGFVEVHNMGSLQNWTTAGGEVQR